jgi:acyl carrier protein
MTRGEIADTVMQALVGVAPELASVPVRSDVPLRDQVDLDSMDFLRFITALHGAFGIEVPEADYGELATVDAVIDYIATRLA